jgi:hypothetical protein
LSGRRFHGEVDLVCDRVGVISFGSMAATRLWGNDS